MITLKRFRRIEKALLGAGHHLDVAWSEQLSPPKSAEEFAEAAVYVIVNSGMKYAVAQAIYLRCLARLHSEKKVRRSFGHKGKARAIDWIWQRKKELFAAYLAASDKLEFCGSLPWVGPVTKYHLAKDLGLDVAKPDVHLARLAERDRTTVARLCRRLSGQTGYRQATIDTLLWRACATGILDSKRYAESGWKAAFRGRPLIEH